MLREEFLEPMGISAYALAKAIGVRQSYISKLYAGGRVSAELGLRLDRFFGLTRGWWSRMQADYDSRVAERKMEDRLLAIAPYNNGV
jgi:addiction module HigA family antidote